jgi:hypothetical protein
MFSPAYEIAKASGAVVAALGTPLRFYSFGDAEQDGTKPYAVHQVVSGNPENYLDRVPDADSLLVQVDVYGKDMGATKTAATALRDAFEPVAHVTGYGGQTREIETRLWRVTFTVEFKAPR